MFCFSFIETNRLSGIQNINIWGPIIFFLDGSYPLWHFIEYLHSAGALMEYFIEFIISDKTLGTLAQMKSVTNIQIFLSELTYQSRLIRALPPIKCSIKAPANLKNSIYVLTKICLQWSKWLGPWLLSSSWEYNWQ